MDLPEIHFGEVSSKETLTEIDESLDDDEELPETDPAIVAILGFDPLD